MKPLVITSLLLSTIMARESSAQKPDTASLIIIRGKEPLPQMWAVDSAKAAVDTVPSESLRIVGDTAYVTIRTKYYSSTTYLFARQPDGSWRNTGRAIISLIRTTP